MGRYKSKKKKNRFGRSIFLLITIFIVICIINEFNSIKEYIEANSEHNELKNEFNSQEFKNRLISRDSLINVLKEEYPNIELVNSTDYGYSNPSNIEEYEIITGRKGNGNTESVGIQIWTYSKDENYLFSSSEDVEFKEVDGKLEQINIIANSKDFPVDGAFMKNLLLVVSKGIGKELTVQEVSNHIDAFLTDTKPFRDAIENRTGYADLAKGSSFNNDDIEFFFSISQPDKRFRVDDVYIYGISVNILDQEAAEKAFKVLYKNKN